MVLCEVFDKVFPVKTYLPDFSRQWKSLIHFSRLCLVLSLDKLAHWHVAERHCLHFVANNFCIFWHTIEILRHCKYLECLFEVLVLEHVDISKADLALVVVRENLHSVHDEVAVVKLGLRPLSSHKHDQPGNIHQSVFVVKKFLLVKIRSDLYWLLPLRNCCVVNKSGSIIWPTVDYLVNSF